MIIYHSMILWIIIWGSYYSLAKRRKRLALRKETTNMVPLNIAVVTFGYIIFWAGIRSGVADTSNYIYMFRHCSRDLVDILACWNSDNKAPGFDTFNILFKHFVSANYHNWLMTIAIISGVPIMLTIRKHSEHFFYSVFLFIVTLNFTWMLNGIRQFVVVAILFKTSDWIVEKKTYKFLLVVLLLSTVHYTALIMIPVYWIVQERPFGKKIIFFTIVLLVSILFFEPFVDVLEVTLADTAYSGYTKQFAMDDGVNPIRFVVMLVPTLIAFVGRRKIIQMNDVYINLCVNMSTVAAGLYFLGIFTSGILIGRLPIYFELYNLILLPYLLKVCFKKQSSRVMYLLCTIGFLLFYYLQRGSLYYISDLTGLILD